MEYFKCLWSVGLIILHITATFSQDFKDGKMSFVTPNMTEEEQHSQHIPGNLACDACTVIAYQITKRLSKEEEKFSGKPLKESQYLDIFEDVCKGETYENYGIKSVNGVNRLSGEGLEAADVPGLLQGGGKWPGRLATKCGAIIGDIGEDELYVEYRKEKELHTYLCKEYTKDCVSTSQPKQEL